MMVITCGNHPEKQDAIRKEQEKQNAKGEPGPMLYFGPRSECEFCHPWVQVN